MSLYDNDAVKLKAEEIEEEAERIADTQCPW